MFYLVKKSGNLQLEAVKSILLPQKINFKNLFECSLKKIIFIIANSKKTFQKILKKLLPEKVHFKNFFKKNYSLKSAP